MKNNAKESWGRRKNGALSLCFPCIEKDKRKKQSSAFFCPFPII